MVVVDVGVGTGLVAREAAYLVGDATRVTGIDPSSGMVQQAKVPLGVRLICGSAEAIPLPSACADFISMGYALRHISDLALAFCEFWRVLRPGGIICLLEITPPERAMRRHPDVRSHRRAPSGNPEADALLLGYHRGVRTAARHHERDQGCAF
jgi:demethylmenaquinone methyltransferase/2-methoxy-6-polyprenyl-1,4-benzoquinol methylase